jgi:hypothetical protein
MKIISTLLLLGVLLTGAFAQRPRSMDPQPAAKLRRQAGSQVVKAKYEGGVFGYKKTMEGTLTLTTKTIACSSKTRSRRKRSRYLTKQSLQLSPIRKSDGQRQRPSPVQYHHLRIAGALYQNQSSLSDAAIQRSGFESQRHHELQA